MWPVFSGKNCSYLSLSSTYKNNYSTFDGYMSVDDDQSLPIRYFKSSNGGPLIDSMLKYKSYPEHIEPAN